MAGCNASEAAGTNDTMGVGAWVYQGERRLDEQDEDEYAGSLPKERPGHKGRGRQRQKRFKESRDVILSRPGPPSRPGR